MHTSRITVRLFFSSCLLLSSLCGSFALAAGSKQTAIASAHPLATHAGFAVMEKGGNAFDAAVAVSAALAVVEPAGSGLGGGGFWLLHRAADGFEIMLDGREKAPLAAHRDMYLDEQGEVLPGLSKNGALAAGIPGLPAALVHLAEHYGKLPLSDSLQPAMHLAEQGFVIGDRHRRLVNMRQRALLNNRAASAVLLDRGKVPARGHRLTQPVLAWTLRQIARHGNAGFYQGEVARRLLKSVQKGGGIWTQQDLDAYQIIERMPIKSTYHDINITSAALPSSGGIVLAQALNILAGFDLNNLPAATRKHLIAEAMRRAYHDRAMYLGDSDFIKVPVKQLISMDYAAGLRRSIRLDAALPSPHLAGEFASKNKGRNTTHFSIIDSEGNRVAATLSINYPFGAAYMAEGTGVLLNNEMDDFSSKPGTMNGYGLTGGAANAIAPGKRMLSSMTPTFLEDESRIAVLGTPGGSRIISMLLLATLDFAKGHAPDSWVSVPRFHHQYMPDHIQYEPGGLNGEDIEALKALGHQLKEKGYRYGNMQALQMHKQTGKLKAASDPRGEGLAETR